VFIKLSLNSANPYPATTDPWSLAFMLRLLREKGAGRIMAGDSSGVESVHWTREHQKGSSRECCKNAGILDIIVQNGAEPVFFEEAGYDTFIPHHASLEDGARIARDAGVSHLLFNHIVPPLPVSNFKPAFLGDAKKIYSGPITIGEDGMLFSLPAAADTIVRKWLL
jgi:hypothetical protein